MLTHDGRRTTHDDGRKPIYVAKGHLSDASDLSSKKVRKSFVFVFFSKKFNIKLIFFKCMIFYVIYICILYLYLVYC